MDFVTLYTTELDRELGSVKTDLFTTARRKAATNQGQLEFVERTECLQRQVSVALSDETQEYDLDDTITDFGWIAKQGVSIQIVSGTTTRYIEGDDLVVTTVERLNTEEPGWRAESAGTPRKVYLRRDGGELNLGFHPAPAITAGDTWTALVPVVIVPAEMSADDDEPFTVSANVATYLRVYHRAISHFAASDLEKLRKDKAASDYQFGKGMEYVERYLQRQRPHGGQRVRLARDYRARAGTVPRRYNPRAVSW